MTPDSLTYMQNVLEPGYADRDTVYHVVSEALKVQTAVAVDNSAVWRSRGWRGHPPHGPQAPSSW